MVPRGHDPASPDLLEGLAPKPAVRRQPAIVDIGQLREMLRKVEDCPCKPTTKLATRFIAVTAVRVGTMMGARWEQFVGIDGPRAIWEIPGEFMKGKSGRKLPFTVPLCTQAVDILEAARKISGDFPWVFPHDVDPERGPISNNAVLFHLYRVGYRAATRRMAFARVSPQL